MRVLSCLAAAAWLLTLAEPCLKPAVCSAPPQHQCCCGKVDQCSCHLKSHRPPAVPPIAVVSSVSQDEQSLPAAQVSRPFVARIAVAAVARPFFEPTAASLPVYLSAHAFRC